MEKKLSWFRGVFQRLMKNGVLMSLHAPIHLEEDVFRRLIAKAAGLLTWRSANSIDRIPPPPPPPPRRARSSRLEHIGCSRMQRTAFPDVELRSIPNWSERALIDDRSHHKPIGRDSER